MAIINFLVEGIVDEAVAIRLAHFTGYEPGTCFGKKGCGYIRKKISDFNLSAEGMNVLALVDLMDTRLSCPAEALSQWLPHRHSNMTFRLVVREIESWLLADSEAMADFLGVRVASIPSKVELLDDPKRTLIDLARTSPKRNIRESLVPKDGISATEGILYNIEMTNFVREFWDVEKARLKAPSLDKCIIRLNKRIRI